MEQKYNLMEKVMLQHAHIPKLIADSTGVLVSAYFFWNQNLLWAITSLLGFSFFGTFLARKRDLNQLADTALGKWMLIQARPQNLVVRGVGTIVLAYGLWVRSAVYIPLGIFLIVFARYWSKRSGVKN